MGPDRADVDVLEKGPARTQADGQPAKVELRDVFNAILYVNRTGIPWKYLPHDFPNHGTVYAYYAAWRDEGIFDQLNYDLIGLARVKEGRKPEPTASVIDTQSVKTSRRAPDQPENRCSQEDRREKARHPHRHDRPHPCRDRHRRRSEAAQIGELATCVTYVAPS